MALRLDEKRVKKLQQAWDACRVLVNGAIADLEAGMSGNEDAHVELSSFIVQMNTFLSEWDKGVRGEEAEAQFKIIKKIPDSILKGTGENEKSLFKALMAIDPELDEKFKATEMLQSKDSKQPKETRETKPKKPESKSKADKKTASQSKTDEEVVQHLVRLFSNYSAAIVKDDDKDDKLHAIDTLWRLVTSYNVTSYNVSVIPEKVSAVINFIKNEFKMPRILANDDRPAAVELREALLKIQPKLEYVKTETKQEYLTRTAAEKHREADFAVLDKVSKSSKDPLNLSKHPMLARDNVVKIQSHDITINRLVEYMLANPDEAHKFIKINKGVDVWGAMNIRRKLCKPENEGLLVLLIVLGGKEMCKVIDETKLLDSLRLSTSAFVRLKSLLLRVSNKETSEYTKETLTTILNSEKKGFDLTFDVIRSLLYSSDFAGYTNQFIKSDIDSKALRKYLIDNPVKAFEIIKRFGIGGHTETENKTKPVSENIAKLLADEDVKKAIIQKIKLMPKSEQDKVERHLIELSVSILAGKQYDIDTNEQYLPIINPIIDLIQAVQPSREQIVAAVIQDLISYHQYDKPTEFNSIKQGRINTFKDIIAFAKKAILDVDSKESKNLQEAYFSQSGVMWQRIFEGRFSREEILIDIFKAASDFAAGELLKLGVTAEVTDKITDELLEEIESASKEEKSEREKPKTYEEMSAEEFDEMLGLIRTEQSKSAASSSKSEDESKEKSKEKSKEEKSESDDARSEAEEVTIEPVTQPAATQTKLDPKVQAGISILRDIFTESKNKDDPFNIRKYPHQASINFVKIKEIPPEAFVIFLINHSDQAMKLMKQNPGATFLSSGKAINVKNVIAAHPELLIRFIMQADPILRKVIIATDLLSPERVGGQKQSLVYRELLDLRDKSIPGLLQYLLDESKKKAHEQSDFYKYFKQYGLGPELRSYCVYHPIAAIEICKTNGAKNPVSQALLAILNDKDMIQLIIYSPAMKGKPLVSLYDAAKSLPECKLLVDAITANKNLLDYINNIRTEELRQSAHTVIVEEAPVRVPAAKTIAKSESEESVEPKTPVLRQQGPTLKSSKFKKTPTKVYTEEGDQITVRRGEHGSIPKDFIDIDELIEEKYKGLSKDKITVLLEILDNDKDYEIILRQAQVAHVDESIMFMKDFKFFLDQPSQENFQAIYDKYISATADKQINIVAKLKSACDKVNKNFKTEDAISALLSVADATAKLIHQDVIGKLGNGYLTYLVEEYNKRKLAEKSATEKIDKLKGILKDFLESSGKRFGADDNLKHELSKIAAIVKANADSDEGKSRPDAAWQNIVKALKDNPPMLFTKGYLPPVAQEIRVLIPDITFKKPDMQKKRTRVEFINPFAMFSKTKSSKPPSKKSTQKPDNDTLDKPKMKK